MSDITKLLSPAMPTLNEGGIELYNQMIENERQTMFKYAKNAAFWHFYESEQPPLQIYDFDDFKENNLISRGKTLVIVKPDFDYKNLCDDLYHSRRTFLNHLKVISKAQNLELPTIGHRSTSNPTLMNFIADDLKYSYNRAYGSASLRYYDVEELIDYKIKKLHQSLQNSQDKKDYKRVRNYEERLHNLMESQSKIKNIDNNIIGRRSSGIALTLRATNKDKNRNNGIKRTKNFGIQHIALIYSDTPSETLLSASKPHKRKKLYETPLFIIKELKIEIYKEIEN